MKKITKILIAILILLIIFVGILTATHYEEQQKIEVLDEYHRTTEKIRVKCKVCGHEWLVTPHNLLLGRGCPECWHKKHSVVSKTV